MMLSLDNDILWWCGTCPRKTFISEECKKWYYFGHEKGKTKGFSDGVKAHQSKMKKLLGL